MSHFTFLKWRRELRNACAKFFLGVGSSARQILSFRGFSSPKSLKIWGILTIKDFGYVTKIDADMTLKHIDDSGILKYHEDIFENWKTRELENPSSSRIVYRCQICPKGTIGFNPENSQSRGFCEPRVLFGSFDWRRNDCYKYNRTTCRVWSSKPRRDLWSTTTDPSLQIHSSRSKVLGWVRGVQFVMWGPRICNHMWVTLYKIF